MNNLNGMGTLIITHYYESDIYHLNIRTDSENATLYDVQRLLSLRVGPKTKLVGFTFTLDAYEK